MAGAVPAYDYQLLAQALLENVAANTGVAPAAAAANAGGTAPYSGVHMDIERAESPMKKFLSDNCADTNATVLQNIRTFLGHVSNVFKGSVVLYGTRGRSRSRRAIKEIISIINTSISHEVKSHLIRVCASATLHNSDELRPSSPVLGSWGSARVWLWCN